MTRVQTFMLSRELSSSVIPSSAYRMTHPDIPQHTFSEQVAKKAKSMRSISVVCRPPAQIESRSGR